LSCLSPELTNKDFWRTFPGGSDGFFSHIAMIGSYVVLSGIVDSLASCFTLLIPSLCNENEINPILPAVAEWLTVMLHCILMGRTENDQRNGLPVEKGGTLVSALAESQMCKFLAVLYTRYVFPSEKKDVSAFNSAEDMRFIGSVLDLLNCFAAVDLIAFQKITANESSAFEILQIASYFMAVSKRMQQPDLLHRTIVLIGHFATLCPETQSLVQTGLLEQLCVLPFSYFSDPHLIRILFPTLISCSFKHSGNREVLEQELNGILLSGFIEDELVAAEKVEEDRYPPDLYSLKFRFPRDLWETARDFFKAPMTE